MIQSSAIVALENSIVNKINYKKSYSDPSKYTNFVNDVKVNFYKIFLDGCPINNTIRAINDNIITFAHNLYLETKCIKPLGVSGTYFLIDKTVVAVIVDSPTVKDIVHLAAHASIVNATQAVIFNPVEGYHRIINISKLVKRLFHEHIHVFVYNKAVAIIQLNFFTRKVIMVEECMEKEKFVSIIKNSNKIINIEKEWIVLNKNKNKNKIELFAPMNDGINNTSDFMQVIDFYYKSKDYLNLE